MCDGEFVFSWLGIGVCSACWWGLCKNSNRSQTSLQRRWGNLTMFLVNCWADCHWRGLAKQNNSLPEYWTEELWDMIANVVHTAKTMKCCWYILTQRHFHQVLFFSIETRLIKSNFMGVNVSCSGFRKKKSGMQEGPHWETLCYRKAFCCYCKLFVKHLIISYLYPDDTCDFNAVCSNPHSYLNGWNTVFV